MPEEIREDLYEAECDKVGEMLLELIAACPYIPEDAKVRYNSKDVGKCIYVMTTGGNVRSRNVLGGSTVELTIKIAYQSFPQDNGQVISAQAVVDSITGWLEDVRNVPRLTGNRTITRITAGGSFPEVEEVEGVKTTVFAANVVMECEVD